MIWKYSLKSRSGSSPIIIHCGSPFCFHLLELRNFSRQPGQLYQQHPINHQVSSHRKWNKVSHTDSATCSAVSTPCFTFVLREWNQITLKHFCSSTWTHHCSGTMQWGKACSKLCLVRAEIHTHELIFILRSSVLTHSRSKGQHLVKMV